ncbi:MAG: hypothetical protein IPN27_11700 [Cellvibrionales bacterium]|nr:hypothetical protein [Cellvibrionales bacterium]
MDKIRDIFNRVHIPGAAWIAFILAIIGWLQGDYFKDEAWVPGVILVLGVVAKLLQMYIFAESYGITDDTTDDARGGYTDKWFSWMRLFWG